MKITNVQAVYPKYKHVVPSWRTQFWQIVVRVETDAGVAGLGYGGGGVAGGVWVAGVGDDGDTNASCAGKHFGGADTRGLEGRDLDSCHGCRAVGRVDRGGGIKKCRAGVGRRGFAECLAGESIFPGDVATRFGSDDDCRALGGGHSICRDDGDRSV